MAPPSCAPSAAASSAARDDPVPAIKVFLTWSFVGVVVDGILLFGVLPAASSFEMLTPRPGGALPAVRRTRRDAGHGPDRRGTDRHRRHLACLANLVRRKLRALRQFQPRPRRGLCRSRRDHQHRALCRRRMERHAIAASWMERSCGRRGAARAGRPRPVRRPDDGPYQPVAPRIAAAGPGRRPARHRPARRPACRPQHRQPAWRPSRVAGRRPRRIDTMLDALAAWFEAATVSERQRPRPC